MTKNAITVDLYDTVMSVILLCDRLLLLIVPWSSRCADYMSHQCKLSHCLKVEEAYSSLCYKHRTAMGACMPYWITQSYLPPGRGNTPTLTPAVTSWYSIYPPIKDERLSRSEPTQANYLSRVATEVLAIPGVS